LKQQVSPGVIAAVIAVAVVLLGYFAWRSLAGPGVATNNPYKASGAPQMGAPGSAPAAANSSGGMGGPPGGPMGGPPGGSGGPPGGSMGGSMGGPGSMGGQ
jgi:hypothetical protein